MLFGVGAQRAVFEVGVQCAVFASEAKQSTLGKDGAMCKKTMVKEFDTSADNKFVGQTNPLPPIVCPAA